MSDIPANLTTVLIALLAMLGLAVPGILTLIQGRKNHKLMNSRLSELLEISKRAAKAEGKIEGQAIEKEKAAQLRAAG